MELIPFTICILAGIALTILGRNLAFFVLTSDHVRAAARGALQISFGLSAFLIAVGWFWSALAAGAVFCLSLGLVFSPEG